MFKKLLFGIVVSFISGLQAQETNSLYKTRKIRATHDTRLQGNVIHFLIPLIRIGCIGFSTHSKAQCTQI